MKCTPPKPSCFIVRFRTRGRKLLFVTLWCKCVPRIDLRSNAAVVRYFTTDNPWTASACCFDGTGLVAACHPAEQHWPGRVGWTGSSQSLCNTTPALVLHDWKCQRIAADFTESYFPINANELAYCQILQHIGRIELFPNLTKKEKE